MPISMEGRRVPVPPRNRFEETEPLAVPAGHSGHSGCGCHGNVPGSYMPGPRCGPGYGLEERAEARDWRRPERCERPERPERPRSARNPRQNGQNQSQGQGAQGGRHPSQPAQPPRGFSRRPLSERMPGPPSHPSLSALMLAVLRLYEHRTNIDVWSFLLEPLRNLVPCEEVKIVVRCIAPPQVTSLGSHDREDPAGTFRINFREDMASLRSFLRIAAFEDFGRTVFFFSSALFFSGPAAGHRRDDRRPLASGADRRPRRPHAAHPGGPEGRRGRRGLLTFANFSALSLFSTDEEVIPSQEAVRRNWDRYEVCLHMLASGCYQTRTHTIVGGRTAKEMGQA